MHFYLFSKSQQKINKYVKEQSHERKGTPQLDVGHLNGLSQL